MPQVKIRRVRSGRQQRVLTAAAQRVDAGNPATFKKSLSSSGGWQVEAERYLELVGELAYYVSWRALSASRCRLTASALDDQGEAMGGIPEDDPNADAVNQVVRDIGNGVTGQSKMMHRIAYLLTIVGECWVGLIQRDPGREVSQDGSPLQIDLTRPGTDLSQWYVFNRSQIQMSGQTMNLLLPDGTKHEMNDDVDVLFRVWEEHPLDPTQAISPVWSNRAVLNEIVQSTLTIDNASKSRLIGNGIIFIPQEVNLPSQVAPLALPTGEVPSNEPAPEWEPNGSQELQDLLYDVASAAVKDPDSLAALLPIIVSAAGDHIKNIQWLRPATDVPETALKTREAAIRRLAMGLDVAPERLLGMGSNANHWTGWLIDETDIKVHISPLVETICQAFTQEILRFQLAEMGLEPDAYVVWYDTTGLTQDPDKTDEAVSAYDRGQLNGESLREHLGFDAEDGYDLTTRQGWAQLAADRAAQDPTLIPLLAPLIGQLVDGVQAPQAALPAAPQDAEAEPDPSAEPGTEAQPAEIVSAAAFTVTRMSVYRALELANKRRRTRSNAPVFRDIDIEDAHTRLSPVELGEVPDLIKGWDSGLARADLKSLSIHEPSFRRLVEVTAAQALTSSQPVRLFRDSVAMVVQHVSG